MRLDSEIRESREFKFRPKLFRTKTRRKGMNATTVLIEGHNGYSSLNWEQVWDKDNCEFKTGLGLTTPPY